MTKKTRLIILAVCAVLFFIITPYILLYSLGYRVDFKKFKIVATGGVYVKALPQGATISIDSHAGNTTNALFNYVFEQNLLPGAHSVAIKKDGYYDYQKSLLVKEQSVTKLEHVILIKKNIAFTVLDANANYFYIAPDGKNILLAKIVNGKVNFSMVNLENQQEKNLLLSIKNTVVTRLTWSDDSSRALINSAGSYFLLQPFLNIPKIMALPYLLAAQEVSFDPQNPNTMLFIKSKNLYSSQQITPIIKNVVTYQVTNNTITWLSYDGFLYRADTANIVANKINTTAFFIKSGGAYSIIPGANIILLQENESLWLLNQTTKIFENFYNPVTSVQISPNKQKILYFNDHEVLFSSLNSNNSDKVFLNRFSDNIGTAFWFNDDYVIFTLQDNIVISEIDIRGNINTVKLPSIVSLSNGKTVDIKNPEIFFNQQDKKLYILSQGNLLSSERLVP